MKIRSLLYNLWLILLFLLMFNFLIGVIHLVLMLSFYKIFIFMTPAFYCILFLDGLFLKYVVNRIVFRFNIYGVVILIEESLSALVCGCFFDVGIFIVIFDWEFVTVLEEVLEMSVESNGETDFGVILKFIDL